MTHKDKYKIFITCVANQKTKMYFIQITDDCDSFEVNVVSTPDWLIDTQFFEIKYQNPHLLVEIPLSKNDNKIYYACNFSEDTHRIS